MKRSATSKPFFSPDEVAGALANAPETAVEDADNPPTRPGDWDKAIASRSLGELRGELAKRRRGPQKQPTKVATTIRFDADVLAALKASGRGWQTRVNDAIREWLKTHPPTSAD